MTTEESAGANKKFIFYSLKNIIFTSVKVIIHDYLYLSHHVAGPSYGISGFNRSCRDLVLHPVSSPLSVVNTTHICQDLKSLIRTLSSSQASPALARNSTKALGV